MKHQDFLYLYHKYLNVQHVERCDVSKSSATPHGFKILDFTASSSRLKQLDAHHSLLNNYQANDITTVAS